MAKSAGTSGDGLKGSLGKALAADRKRRERNARQQAKRQRGHAVDQAMSPADRVDVNALVTPEARRHGDYRKVDFKQVEVVQDGKVKAKIDKKVRNVGGSVVERWLLRGRLDERQMAAVLFYQEAFRKVFGHGPRVTASYSPVRVSGAQGAVELYAGSFMGAKESLRLLDQEVFNREPFGHFCVWQNVVIWDMPAGVAGSQIGFCHKPAEAVAQLIVQSLAYKIADIVIDSSRHDFGDLLIDLDAPRRPGRKIA